MATFSSASFSRHSFSTNDESGSGIPVVFFSGLSRARTRGLSINKIVLTQVGDDLYEVAEEPDVSENDADSTSYRGYEWDE